MIDDDGGSTDEILEEDQALDGYFNALLGVNLGQGDPVLEKQILKKEKKEEVTKNKHYAVFQDEDNGIDAAVVVEPAIVAPLPDIQEFDEQIEEIEIVEEILIPVISEPKPAVLEEIETIVIDVDEPYQQVDIEEVVDAEVDLAVPAWARQEFQCVSFMVQGLQLIVPLEGLNQVYALQEQKIKPIFGQADWFMGMMKPIEESVHVIDAAHWLLPETAEKIQTVEQEYEFVLAFEGSSWGVACDDLGFSEFLKSDDINWHNKDPKRPWLAGVVIEKMCGLIDPEQFVKFLNSKSQGLPVK